MTQPQPAPERRPKPAVLFAINDLRAAVQRLTEPTQSYLNNTFTTIPGLYLQLDTAVQGSQCNTGGGGGSKSRPPFWTDAYEQLQNIDLMVSVWPTGSAGSTLAQLRSLAAKNWTAADLKAVHKWTNIINAWADDIEALLNHEHLVYLRDTACPACGTDTVQKRDNAGDLIRTPALQVNAEHGAMCQNCEAHWAPEYFIDLGKQLGLALPAGVLE